MNAVNSTMILPKVGDKLWRIQTSMTDCIYPIYKAKECIVTYVNKLHNWYEVQFLDSGIKECYGVPVIDHYGLDLDPGNVPVMCVETGLVFGTVSQCARHMNLDDGKISAQLNGWNKNDYHGYHFIKVI